MLLLLFFFFVIFHFLLLFNMARNANNASGDPEVAFLPVGGTTHVADRNDIGDIRATNIDIDRGVLSWFVTGQKTLHADTLDTQRLSAMFHMALTRLCWTVESFVGIRISRLGFEGGRF